VKKRIFPFIAALMMVFVWTVTARAQIMGDLPTFFDVFFDITYNPAAGTPYERGTLSGAFMLYYGSGNMYFPLAEPRPDPILLKSGESFFDVFRFDMGTITDGTSIYMSFNGGVFQPYTSDQIDYAYAFDVGTNSVESDPGVAPLIFLGNAGPDFLAEPRPDPFTLPIFAFASPGVQVGTLTVTDIAAVPEPGTLLLLVSGLAGLAVFRKRFKG